MALVSPGTVGARPLHSATPNAASFLLRYQGIYQWDHYEFILSVSKDSMDAEVRNLKTGDEYPVDFQQVNADGSGILVVNDAESPDAEQLPFQDDPFNFRFQEGSLLIQYTTNAPAFKLVDLNVRYADFMGKYFTFTPDGGEEGAGGESYLVIEARPGAHLPTVTYYPSGSGKPQPLAVTTLTGEGFQDGGNFSSLTMLTKMPGAESLFPLTISVSPAGNKIAALADDNGAPTTFYQSASLQKFAGTHQTIGKYGLMANETGAKIFLILRNDGEDLAVSLLGGNSSGQETPLLVSDLDRRYGSFTLRFPGSEGLLHVVYEGPKQILVTAENNEMGFWDAAP